VDYQTVVVLGFGEASILLLLVTVLLGIDDQKDVACRVQGNLEVLMIFVSPFIVII
jgi:hypothetical protein